MPGDGRNLSAPSALRWAASSGATGALKTHLHIKINLNKGLQRVGPAHRSMLRVLSVIHIFWFPEWCTRAFARRTKALKLKPVDGLAGTSSEWRLYSDHPAAI